MQEKEGQRPTGYVLKEQPILSEGHIVTADVTCGDDRREGIALIAGRPVYVIQRYIVEGRPPAFEWVHAYWLDEPDREQEEEDEPEDMVVEMMNRIESPDYNKVGKDDPYYVAPEDREEEEDIS